MPGSIRKTSQVPEGRPGFQNEITGDGGTDAPSLQPSRWDSCRCRRIPGVETPGYYRVVPLGRARADGRAFRMPQGQRGAPKSDEGGRVALALRTMLGDDGNQIGAHSALPIPHLNGSFPVFILGWTIGAIGVECDGMTSLSSIRHVASNQSADVSAHSKAASGHITCRNKTGFGK